MCTSPRALRLLGRGRLRMTARRWPMGVRQPELLDFAPLASKLDAATDPRRSARLVALSECVGTPLCGPRRRSHSAELPGEHARAQALDFVGPSSPHRGGTNHYSRAKIKSRSEHRCRPIERPTRCITPTLMSDAELLRWMWLEWDAVPSLKTLRACSSPSERTFPCEASRSARQNL